MLNTFSNASRIEPRRAERERTLRAMNDALHDAYETVGSVGSGADDDMDDYHRRHHPHGSGAGGGCDVDQEEVKLFVHDASAASSTSTSPTSSLFSSSPTSSSSNKNNNKKKKVTTPPHDVFSSSPSSSVSLPVAPPTFIGQDHVSGRGNKSNDGSGNSTNHENDDYMEGDGDDNDTNDDDEGNDDDNDDDEDLARLFVDGPGSVFGSTVSGRLRAKRTAGMDDVWDDSESLPSPGGGGIGIGVVGGGGRRGLVRGGSLGEGSLGGGAGASRAANDSSSSSSSKLGAGASLLREMVPTFSPRNGSVGGADLSGRNLALRGGVDDDDEDHHDYRDRRNRGHHHRRAIGSDYDFEVPDVPFDRRMRGRRGYGGDGDLSFYKSTPGLNRCVGGLCAASRWLCTPTRLLLFVLISVGLALAIVEIANKGLSRGINLGGEAGDDDEPFLSAHHPYPNHNLARIEAVAKRIINSGASTREELSVPSDPTTMPRTPQNRAMEWIALSDPSPLDPDDDFLLQRYGLAVFWYATHPHLLLPFSSSKGTAHKTGVDDEEKDAEKSKGGAGGDNGPEWDRSDGWMTGYGICSWHGVRCRPIVDPHLSAPMSGSSATEKGGGMNGSSSSSQYGSTYGSTELKTLEVYNGNGEVTGLLLAANNIGGTLPDEIFTTLTELDVVDLNGNGLNGQLPDALGRLKRVRTLSFSGNALTGTIPETVSGLSNIHDLDLSENMFSGTIPAESIVMLGDTLTELSLYNNDLTGTISTLMGELQRIESLYLDSNKLWGTIPLTLERCHRLRDLRLRDNVLTGQLPDQLGELSNLKVLYLDSNELTGPLPASFGMISSLEELNLYDNNLSGTLPEAWEGLYELRHLYLDGNGALSGTMPPTWGKGKGLAKLKHLYLSNNKIHGPIPPDVSSMSGLEKLHLRNNHFAGTIPSDLGRLEHLTELMLEGNLLKGTVPTELGYLGLIETLAVQRNHLSGTMPGEICALRNPEDGKLTSLTVRCVGEMDESNLSCDCCTQC